ncbi:helix-turn-helix domain-containing protein [Neorhizobium sp. LjRoot104]|uniref:helix-turn-helix domain-containing protein n=1 Tax=Neorhizobium sp. LjRoot104 TaxID=3342254 RepID=UPI003ECF4D8C
MGTIDSAWFHEKLAEKGSSLRDMARFMELDPSAVSRMLSGERKMSADEQDQISAFLGIDLDEIAAHRRGEARGFSESKQAAYERELLPPERHVNMFTEADIIYEDGKRWMEKEDGTLIELHPAYGCMKGTMIIPPDLDLTAPADPDWGKVYEDD